MSDFFQTGVITTLHQLGKAGPEVLEGKLKKFTKTNPVALILPCLYSELEGPAIKGIIDEIKEIKYLRQIVITMSQLDEEKFRQARKFFSALPQEHVVIWNDGPRVTEIYKMLEAAGVSAGGDGKGRSVWMSYGYLIADGKSEVFALHDCDIVTYNRGMVARLCYPVVNPNMAYFFAKGFYSRVTDKLHGRVTRLMVTPLIRALQKIIGFTPLLVFLDSFRYPLAGEFAMNKELAAVNRIPGDWGLEIGTLVEIYRNSAVRRICEVDISENYEHKHQALSSENPNAGLHKMAIDIAKALFRNLASEGIVLSEGVFKTLKAIYLRYAQEQVKRYDDDASINGLSFDRHVEGSTVEMFAHAIEGAAKQYLEDPLGAPLIPNWTRVTSAIPDIYEKLKDAIDADNK